MAYQSVQAEQIVIQPGPDEGMDAWVTSVYSDYGRDDHKLRVGGWADYYYSLIRFDLKGLQSNVTSAKVYMYCFNDGHSNRPSMYLDRVTSIWDENTRWYDKPSYTNISTLPAPILDSWYVIDITDSYNSWKNDDYENYGIQLRPTSNNDDMNAFYSSDYMDDPSLRPKLVLEVDPLPDIKVNGQNGPITVSSSTLVAITISLRPGDQSSKNVDWWIVANTPFGWYSYVYPTGWVTGINLCTQSQLFDLSPPFEIFNATLPIGKYFFYFAVDDNVDGMPDATWMDSAEVDVQENRSPTATLTSPSSGTTFTEGKTVSFIGSGTDPEDGQLTGTALIWTSDKDGHLGTGESFTKNDLSVNSHTITLTVRDSEGAAGTASIEITVASTPSPDPYEPNDSFVQAIYLTDSKGSGYYKEYTINPYIYSPSDVDYFRISVNTPLTMLAVSEWEISYGRDYDIFLYDSSYNEIAQSATRPSIGGVNMEKIDYFDPPQGTYYIKVVGYNGAYATDSPYTLALMFVY